MRIPATIFGLTYAIGGFLFAINSAPRGGTDTHWGYALTGIVSLVIGARFLGLPANRNAHSGKMVRSDPLEWNGAAANWQDGVGASSPR